MLTAAVIRNIIVLSYCYFCEGAGFLNAEALVIFVAELVTILNTAFIQQQIQFRFTEHLLCQELI